MAQKILDALGAKFGAAVTSTSSVYGDEVATVARERLVDIATFLRDDPAMRCDYPSYCTVIDWLGFDRKRFEVVYQLRSLAHGHRIRLKIELDEDDPRCPTLSGVWPAFNWLEREAFDMYGVTFDGHPDLRRIYMYDEFVGHPLRKDYPKDKRQPLVRRSFDE